MSDPIIDAIRRMQRMPRAEFLPTHPDPMARLDLLIAETDALLAEHRAATDALDQAEAAAVGVSVSTLVNRRKRADRKKMRQRRRGDRAGRPL